MLLCSHCTVGGCQKCQSNRYHDALAGCEVMQWTIIQLSLAKTLQMSESRWRTIRAVVPTRWASRSPLWWLPCYIRISPVLFCQLTNNCVASGLQESIVNSHCTPSIRPHNDRQSWCVKWSRGASLSETRKRFRLMISSMSASAAASAAVTKLFF